MIRVDFHEQILRQRIAPTGWRAWLGMAASLVVGLTLFALAATLALILIPIVTVAGGIAIWRIRRRLRAAGYGEGGPGPSDIYRRDEIIDAEYRIIETGEPPRR